MAQSVRNIRATGFGHRKFHQSWESALIEGFSPVVRPIFRAMVLSAAVAAVAGGVTARDAAAQAWPTKPVHLIMAATPGAATDMVARLVADRLGARLGQPVIVEYRPGAGGNVGYKLVAKAPADGYTLLIAAHPGFTTAPVLTKDPGFDPVHDFAPITGVAKFSLLLALHPSVPAYTLQELVAYARARPGQLNFASPGLGMVHHLTMELFKHTAGIDLLHVPYKGGAMATQDLIAGRVQAMFGSWVIFGQHVQSGRLRAIGASSGARLTQAPDIRTIAEQGYPGFDVWAWYGLLAPAGTPSEVVVRIAAETQAILETPDSKERLFKLGLESYPISPPAAFAEQVKADVAKWAKVIRDAAIKPE